MGAAGKRVGSRRGPKKRSLPSRRVLILCLAITVAVVAWGYLVLAAIEFGSAARGGKPAAWGFLALACLGAAACLFAGLILVGRLLRAAGIIIEPTPAPSEVAYDKTSAPRVTSHVTAPLPGSGPGSGPSSSPGHSYGAPMNGGQASDANDTAPLPAVPAPRHQGGKRAAR